jgi:RsiW-degrading membrane proteinase PrsW (M82 family)
MSEVTPAQLPQHDDTLELINTEVTASLARLSDSGSSIDTKAAILVGYVAVAASFLATRHAQPVLAALAYAAYGLSAVFGIWAYAVRLYQDVPDPRQLFNTYYTQPKAQVLAALAATRAEAYETNARKHAGKARRWWICVLSLVVGVVLMLFALTSAYW